jgi:hypothetical protein
VPSQGLVVRDSLALCSITDASLAIQESRKRGAYSINASAMISACAIVSLFLLMLAS